MTRTQRPPRRVCDESRWFVAGYYVRGLLEAVKHLAWPRPFAMVRAVAGGYFWLACPRCGRMFGGHEVTPACDTIRDPRSEVAIGPGMDTRALLTCCPVCSALNRPEDRYA